MKILPASSIRLLDRQTMELEPIASIDLMERAASLFTDWLLQKFSDQKSFHIVAGIGNNGGDGLVVARLLCKKAKKVIVSIVHFASNTSNDFAINLERLEVQNKIGIKHLNEGDRLTNLSSDYLLIDALWGSGLSRPVEGFGADIIEQINASGLFVLSIDMPSGLFADKSSTGFIVKASATVSFQLPKLAFFFPENQEFTGDWSILDIGLNKEALEDMPTENNLLTFHDLQGSYIPRKRFEHKGNRGHSLLIGGSFGKMGAMVLAAKACLRSGCGLATVLAPACGTLILQKTIPEVMLLKPDGENKLKSMLLESGNWDAIGVGPGMGTEQETSSAFLQFITSTKHPVVIDADALNILAANSASLDELPANSILTPHPGEFKRLAGHWENGFERLTLQKAFSKRYKVIVVLKGAWTCTTLPDGSAYFNPSGNPGMATAGSGDTLTGIITSLLAQAYPPAIAASLGVYLHGLAGDFAAEELGMDSLMAGDIIRGLT